MELLNNKPLLEFLSPYADKTLSEGCIIVDEKMLCKYIINKGLNGNVTFNDGFIRTKIHIDSHIFIKILGHIGITTVLKYLERNSGVKNFVKHWKIYDDYILYEEWIGEDCTITKIPNKELHLYTKQELITLYNLLKELG